MGIQTEDSLLTWEECVTHAEEIRTRATQAFIAHYDKHRHRRGDTFLVGDEIEQYLVKFDHKKKRVYLALKAGEVLEQLRDTDYRDKQSNWTPEFSDYQIESTPGLPYVNIVENMTAMEESMAYRRKQLQASLGDDEAGLSLTLFPRLATNNYTWPPCVADATTSSCRSSMFPQDAISKSSSRYSTLVRNIYEMMDGKSGMNNIPIFRDVTTGQPFLEHSEDSTDVSEALPDHVYTDYFVVDCNSVQVNLQASSLDDAVFLYDQLAVLAPLIMALTASSPIHRGFLLEEDTRWHLMEYATDISKLIQQQLKLGELRNTGGKIQDTYTAIGCIEGYLSPGGDRYNDTEVLFNNNMYEALVEGGVDELMSRHIAHVNKTPLLIRRKLIGDHNDQSNNLDLFRMIYSTCWQLVKLKIPEDREDDGWKVEFRTAEVQVTDFENAATCMFISLLARAILRFRLDMRIPISMLKKNVDAGCARDAAQSERFYFRKPKSVGINMAGYSINKVTNNKTSKPCTQSADVCELMSIDEIFNGKGNDGGLLSYIRRFLDEQEVNGPSRQRVDDYLSLLSKRASGKLLTPASWMRKFVMSHSEYKGDSVVSERITYDLIWKLTQISKGKAHDPMLLPENCHEKYNYPTLTQSLF